MGLLQAVAAAGKPVIASNGETRYFRAAQTSLRSRECSIRVAGGKAVADLLFGDVVPGRKPVTAENVGQVPIITRIIDAESGEQDKDTGMRSVRSIRSVMV